MDNELHAIEGTARCIHAKGCVLADAIGRGGCTKAKAEEVGCVCGWFCFDERCNDRCLQEI